MMTTKTTDDVAQSFCSLTGQLLIAMPGIDDTRFDKTVIYIYSHTKETGAIGLVINQPTPKISFKEILEQLHIKYTPLSNPPQILIGGPAQSSRGFILHSPDYNGQLTVPAGPNMSLTATQDILLDLVNGTGPKKSLIALGCATWSSGQLEEEIMSNVWLTAQATDDLIFTQPYDRRWNIALKELGITPYYLSSTAGKA